MLSRTSKAYTDEYGDKKGSPKPHGYPPLTSPRTRAPSRTGGAEPPPKHFGDRPGDAEPLTNHFGDRPGGAEPAPNHQSELQTGPRLITSAPAEPVRRTARSRRNLPPKRPELPLFDQILPRCCLDAVLSPFYPCFVAGLYIGPPPLLVSLDIDNRLELDLLSEQPYSRCVSSLHEGTPTIITNLLH